MVDLRCPHDPFPGECPDCAAIKRKADQAAALEARMEAIARKVVVEHMGDCSSCAAKDARIKELEVELAAFRKRITEDELYDVVDTALANFDQDDVGEIAGAILNHLTKKGE